MSADETFFLSSRVVGRKCLLDKAINVNRSRAQRERSSVIIMQHNCAKKRNYISMQRTVTRTFTVDRGCIVLQTYLARLYNYLFCFAYGVVLHEC